MNYNMEEQLIYVGPTIASLGLLRHQVYLGGIPGQVRASIADYPEVSELIVPIDELDEARIRVRKKGEHLHHIAEELKRKVGVE